MIKLMGLVLEHCHGDESIYSIGLEWGLLVHDQRGYLIQCINKPRSNIFIVLHFQCIDSFEYQHHKVWFDIKRHRGRKEMYTSPYLDLYYVWSDLYIKMTNSEVNHLLTMQMSP